MKANTSYFDTNGDGKPTAVDAGFAKIKALAQPGITQINLTGDSTRIELPDGSVIQRQTTFTRSNGTTGTVASTALMTEVDGHRVAQVVTTDACSNRLVTSTAYDAAGKVLYVIKSVTSASGAAITNSYDDDGDGVMDRVQTITTVTNANRSKTETVINKVGAVVAVSRRVRRSPTSRCRRVTGMVQSVKMLTLLRKPLKARSVI